MTLSPVILRNINPKVLTLSVSSVLMGTAAAVLRGNMEIFPATLALLFAVLLQISAQLFIKYYRLERGWKVTIKSVFDVGDTSLTFTQILKESSYAFLIIAFTAGFSLIAMSGWWSLIIGFAVGICFMLGFVIKKPLYDTPWSLLLTFIIFGPIGVVGTCMLQSDHESISTFNLYDILPAFFTCVICGLFATNVHLIKNCIEYEEDKKNGRRTICTLHGFKTARALYWINAIGITAVCWTACHVLNLHNLALEFIVPAITLGLNGIIASKIRLHTTKQGFLKLQTWSILIMLVFSLNCFVLFWIFGVPDDSTLYIF